MVMVKFVTVEIRHEIAIRLVAIQEQQAEKDFSANVVFGKLKFHVFERLHRTRRTRHEDRGLNPGVGSVDNI
jgi:hypothetical protein